MKSQILELAELQKVENEIMNINRSLAKIPEELDSLDQQRDELQTALNQTKEKIDTLQKQYRAWESDSQAISAKIGKETEKLRSVKNNKEYQAMLAEIEHTKTDQSKIEDQMIASLETIDDVKAQLAKEKEAFDRSDAQLARQKEAINYRAKKYQGQLETLETSRSRLVDNLEPDVLSRFQHVKTIKNGGQAVAPVQDAICRGCNMNIPPQLYNELQRFDSLLMCPNCQRIIYHAPSDESKA